jgi:sensor histidine kinase YesM
MGIRGAGPSESPRSDRRRGPRTPETLHRIGIGIANVERRIALNFGAPYGVEIESEPGAFTLVRFVVPALARLDLPSEASRA